MSYILKEAAALGAIFSTHWCSSAVLLRCANPECVSNAEVNADNTGEIHLYAVSTNHGGFQLDDDTTPTDEVTEYTTGPVRGELIPEVKVAQSEQRPFAALHFWCEHCHYRTTLSFGNYKGETRILAYATEREVREVLR